MTLVFFGYTHCPDICNIVLANIASALRGAEPAVRDDVRLLFVTTDPARDTPDVVRELPGPVRPGVRGPDRTGRDGREGRRGVAEHQLREAGRLATAGATRSTTAPTRPASVDGTARVVWIGGDRVGGPARRPHPPRRAA